MDIHIYPYDIPADPPGQLVLKGYFVLLGRFWFFNENVLTALSFSNIMLKKLKFCSSKVILNLF